MKCVLHVLHLTPLQHFERGRGIEGIPWVTSLDFCAVPHSGLTIYQPTLQKRRFYRRRNKYIPLFNWFVVYLRLNIIHLLCETTMFLELSTSPMIFGLSGDRKPMNACADHSECLRIGYPCGRSECGLFRLYERSHGKISSRMRKLGEEVCWLQRSSASRAHIHYWSRTTLAGVKMRLRLRLFCQHALWSCVFPNT